MFENLSFPGFFTPPTIHSKQKAAHMQTQQGTQTCVSLIAFPVRPAFRSDRI